MQAHALKLSREGRVLIQVDVRAELGLTEGSTMSLRVQDGEIRLVDLAQALRRAQQIAAKYARPGESVVDELISERRQAAAQELSGFLTALRCWQRFFRSPAEKAWLRCGLRARALSAPLTMPKSSQN